MSVLILGLDRRTIDMSKEAVEAYDRAFVQAYDAGEPWDVAVARAMEAAERVEALIDADNGGE